MIKIAVERRNEAFHFEGITQDGIPVHMDSNPEMGGEGKGIRPMQMLLYGIAGCSGIDMVMILEKQRQVITNFKIEVEAVREKDVTPALFETIHVRFILEGKDLQEEKVQKAMELSMTKYCSVAKMLEKASTITSSFVIN